MHSRDRLGTRVQDLETVCYKEIRRATLHATSSLDVSNAHARSASLECMNMGWRVSPGEVSASNEIPPVRHRYISYKETDMCVSVMFT